MFKNLSAAALNVSGFQSELIELALSFGYRGLDVKLAELGDAAQPSAKRLLASAPIELGCAPLPVRWQEDDRAFQEDLDALGPLVAAGTKAGCRRLVTTIAPADDDRPYHENFEFHRRRLSDLAAALKPHDVRLGCAICGAASARAGRAFEFIHDLDALLLLIRTVRDPSIGVVVNPWDIIASGGSLADLDKATVDDLVAVELSDGPADVPPADWSDDDRLLPAAGGTADGVALLVRLAEMGYTGPVAPRASAKSLRGQRREAVVKQAAEGLNDLFKAAGITTKGKLAAANK